MRFEYKVVPFHGQLRRFVFNDDGVGKVAADLQNLLNTMSTEGWDFVRVDEIQVSQSAGCLAYVLGNKGSSVFRMHLVVFRRPIVGP